MKLEKAVEILELGADTADMIGRYDFRDALKLCIEALKWRQQERASGRIDRRDLLPGETL